MHTDFVPVGMEIIEGQFEHGRQEQQGSNSNSDTHAQNMDGAKSTFSADIPPSGF